MKVAYLIDTDWTIDYLNDKEPVASKIEELRKEGIGLSIVSLAELYEGVYHSRDPEASERKLLGFLSGVAILGIDEEICQNVRKRKREAQRERSIDRSSRFTHRLNLAPLWNSPLHE